MAIKNTSMRLDAETKKLIERLAHHRGGNGTTVVKQAVREMARKEGLLEERQNRAANV